MTVTDERVRIESYSQDDNSEYVSAVLCRDMDEAVELLEQERVRRPFLVHKLHRLADPVASLEGLDDLPDPVKTPGE